MRLGELHGRRVGIWGLGREGEAAARAARSAGAAEVVVVDSRAPDVGAEWQATADTGALASCDVVLRSPGISRYRPDVLELATRTRLTTGTAIALAEFAAIGQPLLCVTGTKGKSTTSALVAGVLQSCGVNAAHVGNIGTPLLALLAEPLPDVVVAEISSYQAADTDVSPELGAVTSLAPEHLDWHGSAERYFTDKLRIFTHRPDTLVVVSDQARPIAGRYLPAEILRTPDEVVDRAVLDGFSAGTLPGRHNRENARLALACAARLGADLTGDHDRIEAGLQAFQRLPHRLTPVVSLRDVTYVDDTLSTTPLSVAAALEAYSDRDVTLLAGGQDRGLDFTDLAQTIADRPHAVRLVTMPDSGPRIAAAVRDACAAAGRDVAVLEVVDLAAAVAAAADLTPPGGLVLLSPGSPSYHRYTNYEALSAAYVGLLTEAGAVAIPPDQEAAPRARA